MSQVLIFGASITQGLWDSEGGWADRLKRYLMQSYLPSPTKEIHVYNLGISGNNSQHIADRFDAETKQRMRHSKTLFIFSFGGNDSHLLNDKQVSKTPKDIFFKNILNIMQQAKKYSNLIVFVGLSPVDESKTNPIPWETNVSYKNDLLKQYDNIIKDICKQENIHFIEIFDGLIRADYKNLLEDGLHPNTKGHKMIFETVRDYLVSHDIISSL